jgi:hypothetical protein
MLTVEIKVNGVLVAAINAINRGGEAFGRCEYEWASAEFRMQWNGPPVVHDGKLTHDRPDGCIELTRRLCEAHKAATAK